MNFELSDSQQQFFDLTVKFSREVLEKNATKRISTHEFDRNLWQKAVDFGIAGLPVPESLGGMGLSALDCMLAIEALGKGTNDLGLVFSLSAHVFASVVPIWRFGSKEIHQKYLEPLINGQYIAANAVTEPNAGSDIYNMKTTAEEVDNGYILHGQKCFVTNAPIADLFIVYAKTDTNLGFFGVSAFIIHKNAAGLTIGNNRVKDSLCTSTWSEVYLDKVFVSEKDRLGQVGAGGAIFHDSMVWEKGCLFAAYVGAMERVYEQCLEHVKQRIQFASPIGEYQSVSNRIIDMKLRLESARLMLYRSGWLYDQGQDSESEIALSKIMISEAAIQTGLDAIQIFGASAIENEMGVSRLLLDAIPSPIFSGSNDIQREIISRKLGLRKA
ncbi:acyl-CoA dehydrogenase [Pseudoalteromonas sp. NBT06-2]|uniref:acyl-CoA dehydrogenase family protein n=1 Tax=Pseudoalteromonas sp. NBT06-2 TaxID=2025950 RepID=UPI000BA6448D|nr:acyl-CoA dehydrogenase family protein [Pseudoalteromonas sp. NBT06-2]PAJ72895.1 acyl-CoA dehydrogenase [Pseudoalteromonas sp. NBT06-2]